AMCPQGTTWEEWLECAIQMIHMGCATLCVAKRYEKLPGGRSYALRMIEAEGWNETHTIHLLGCYRNPLREIYRAHQTMPSIRGVDTGAAIAYTQHNVSLNSPDHCSLDWDAPFDSELAKANIDLYLHAHEENYAYNA